MTRGRCCTPRSRGRFLTRSMRSRWTMCLHAASTLASRLGPLARKRVSGPWIVGLAFRYAVAIVCVVRAMCAMRTEASGSRVSSRGFHPGATTRGGSPGDSAGGFGCCCGGDGGGGCCCGGGGGGGCGCCCGGDDNGSSSGNTEIVVAVGEATASMCNTIFSISHFSHIVLSLSLTHTHTLSLSLTHTHSLSHSLTHTHSLSLSHTHSLSLSFTLSHALSHYLSLFLTHSLTHSLTHTHTQMNSQLLLTSYKSSSQVLHAVFPFFLSPHFISFAPLHLLFLFISSPFLLR